MYQLCPFIASVFTVFFTFLFFALRRVFNKFSNPARNSSGASDPAQLAIAATAPGIAVVKKTVTTETKTTTTTTTTTSEEWIRVEDRRTLLHLIRTSVRESGVEGNSARILGADLDALIENPPEDGHDAPGDGNRENSDTESVSGAREAPAGNGAPTALPPPAPGVNVTDYRECRSDSRGSSGSLFVPRRRGGVVGGGMAASSSLRARGFLLSPTKRRHLLRKVTTDDDEDFESPAPRRKPKDDDDDELGGANNNNNNVTLKNNAKLIVNRPQPKSFTESNRSKRTLPIKTKNPRPKTVRVKKPIKLTPAPIPPNENAVASPGPSVPVNMGAAFRSPRQMLGKDVEEALRGASGPKDAVRFPAVFFPETRAKTVSVAHVETRDRDAGGSADAAPPQRNGAARKSLFSIRSRIDPTVKQKAIEPVTKVTTETRSVAAADRVGVGVSFDVSVVEETKLHLQEVVESTGVVASSAAIRGNYERSNSAPSDDPFQVTVDDSVDARISDAKKAKQPKHSTPKRTIATTTMKTTTTTQKTQPTFYSSHCISENSSSIDVDVRSFERIPLDPANDAAEKIRSPLEAPSHPMAIQEDVSGLARESPRPNPSVQSTPRPSTPSFTNDESETRTPEIGRVFVRDDRRQNKNNNNGNRKTRPTLPPACPYPGAAPETTSSNPDNSLADPHPPLLRDFYFVTTLGDRGHAYLGDLSLESTQLGKQELQRLLRAHGGNILAQFQLPDLARLHGRVITVANTFCRTAKYIMSLASGIPVVPHKWLVDSIANRRPMNTDDYLLPAGLNIETELLCPQRPRHFPVFTAKSVVVCSADPNFALVWSPVLTAAGCARVVVVETSHAFGQEEMDRIDIVVGDVTLGAESAVASSAASGGVPVVSSEWIIQSLVQAKCVDPRGHSRYRHTYVDSSSG